MKLSGKITVDRRSLLGSSSTPMLFLFKQEVVWFFFSLGTLSALLAFSTLEDSHTLFSSVLEFVFALALHVFLVNQDVISGRV